MRILIPLLFLTLSIAARGADRKPNVIVFLADDLGYGQVGCFGQRLIKTPNLDRMAREGMRLTHFYAGSPVCAPSRSVLMTGLHTGHTRVRGNAGRQSQAQVLREADVTAAEVFKKAGYATALIGKWGLGQEGSEGEPRRQGFDHFFGYLDQVHAHNSYPEFLLRNEERVPLKNRLLREGKPYEQWGAGWSEYKGDFAPDLLAGDALRWIEEKKDQPFFLYFATVVPHANNEATKVNGNGQEVPDLAPYKDAPWSEPDKGHAAAITRMDADLGRMLDLLKKLGIDKQTLVLFSADNGHHKEGGYDPQLFDANGPLRGLKRDLYEGGIRVPSLAWWPGTVPAASELAAPGHFADFLPTAVEIAGAPPLSETDGVSLMPALTGGVLPPRTKPLYWEFHEGGFSQATLLDGRWKAIRLKNRRAPIEIYDLQEDLGESRDLAALRPELVTRATQVLAESRAEAVDWPILEKPAR